MKSFLLVTIAFLLLFTGCGKKAEPVKVGELNEYKDPAFGFKIKYPKEWKNFGEAGKAIFAKTQEVVNKFLDPRTGEEGAQVTVQVIKYAGSDAEDLIQLGRDELKQTWQNIQVSPDEKINVAGKEVIKIAYGIPVTSKKQISGYDIYVAGDTAMYKLMCLGYGDQYEAHAEVFSTMISSFELPVIVAKKSDQWTPSGNMETYKSDFFTMLYPDNLEFNAVKKAAKHDFAMEMRADRLDCSIHIDVFGAQKLTVEKVWDQNKGTYNAKNSGQIQIDGQTAFWADYSPRKDIGSRVYFTVKNDKVLRITINYFAAQKDIYFPTFENMVKSLKIK
ncbi:MAG: hypothetical protein HZB59_11580 [Ignavibacteriales bacterium]|nr:hypothetical protein [Ignavibacteriales bacterium]